MQSRTLTLGVVLGLGLSVTTISCGAGDGAAEDTSTVQSAILGWVGPISDEVARACSQSRVGVIGARCKGSHCDDMYINCVALPLRVQTQPYSYTPMPDITQGFTGAYWAKRSDGSFFVSEEGIWGGNAGIGEICDENLDGVVDGLLIGMRARGNDSDDVNVLCARFTSSYAALFASSPQAHPCAWTPFFSEEQGEQNFAANSFAVGIRCRGSNCDDVSYRVCTF